MVRDARPPGTGDDRAGSDDRPLHVVGAAVLVLALLGRVSPMAVAGIGPLTALGLLTYLAYAWVRRGRAGVPLPAEWSALLGATGAVTLLSVLPGSVLLSALGGNLLILSLPAWIAAAAMVGLLYGAWRSVPRRPASWQRAGGVAGAGTVLAVVVPVTLVDAVQVLGGGAGLGFGQAVNFCLVDAMPPFCRLCELVGLGSPGGGACFYRGAGLIAAAVSGLGGGLALRTRRRDRLLAGTGMAAGAGIAFSVLVTVL